MSYPYRHPRHKIISCPQGIEGLCPGVDEYFPMIQVLRGVDSMSEDRSFYDIQEAAEMLDVSPRTVRRYIKKGEIKAEKKNTQFGKKWFIPASEIEEERAIQDIVPVRKPVSKDEFQKALGEVLEIKLNEHRKQIRKEVSEEVSKEITQLQDRIDQLEAQLEGRDQELLSAIREKQKNPPNLWKRVKELFS